MNLTIKTDDDIEHRIENYDGMDVDGISEWLATGGSSVARFGSPTFGVVIPAGAVRWVRYDTRPTERGMLDVDERPA